MRRRRPNKKVSKPDANVKIYVQPEWSGESDNFNTDSTAILQVVELEFVKA
jgi:hypothetical protein